MEAEIHQDKKLDMVTKHDKMKSTHKENKMTAVSNALSYTKVPKRATMVPTPVAIPGDEDGESDGADDPDQPDGKDGRLPIKSIFRGKLAVRFSPPRMNEALRTCLVNARLGVGKAESGFLKGGGREIS